MLLLMGLSNKTGRMLLTTGNKREMAVGLRDLYGEYGRRLRADQGLQQAAGVRLADLFSTRCSARPGSRLLLGIGRGSWPEV